MKLKSLILTLCLAGAAFPLGAEANKVETAEGEAIYISNPSDSKEDCIRKALEMARLNAIASTFGTSLSMQTIHQTTQLNSTSSEYSNISSRSNVNGEWISDLGKPSLKVELDDEQNYVVTCRVKGKVRRNGNNAAVEAILLKNGSNRQAADTRFKPNDELKLLFRTSCDGYALVYMMDEAQNVIQMLPYSGSTSSAIRVKRDCEYLFFDSSVTNSPFGEPDEYVMSLPEGKKQEFNRCYVLFSPEPLTRCVKGDITTQSVDYNEFINWLGKCSERDPKLNLNVMDFVIERN